MCLYAVNLSTETHINKLLIDVEQPPMLNIIISDYNQQLLQLLTIQYLIFLFESQSIVARQIFVHIYLLMLSSMRLIFCFAKFVFLKSYFTTVFIIHTIVSLIERVQTPFKPLKIFFSYIAAEKYHHLINN